MADSEFDLAPLLSGIISFLAGIVLLGFTGISFGNRSQNPEQRSFIESNLGASLLGIGAIVLIGIGFRLFVTSLN